MSMFLNVLVCNACFFLFYIDSNIGDPDALEVREETNVPNSTYRSREYVGMEKKCLVS